MTSAPDRRWTLEWVQEPCRHEPDPHPMCWPSYPARGPQPAKSTPPCLPSRRIVRNLGNLGESARSWPPILAPDSGQPAGRARSCPMVVTDPAQPQTQGVFDVAVVGGGLVG